MSTIDISIIIATRHRENILWETVKKAYEAIKNNAEIIIVNDGNTALNVPAFFVDKIQCFDNPKRGVSSARNFAVSKAKGETLFFIDDDMWINATVIDWINSFVVNKPEVQAVYNINWEYPPVLNEQLASTKIGQYLLSSKYNTMWGRMDIKDKQPENGLYQYYQVGSGSLVINKKIFEMAGRYNEFIVFQGEDIGFSDKLKALAIPVYAVFDVTLFHNQQDRLNINSYLKRNAEGFESEFKAVKTGIIDPFGAINYNGPIKIIFEFFRITEKGWIFLLNILPGKKITIAFNNKLIGILTGLQRYKQWKKILR